MPGYPSNLGVSPGMVTAKSSLVPNPYTTGRTLDVTQSQAQGVEKGPGAGSGLPAWAFKAELFPHCSGSGL